MRMIVRRTRYTAAQISPNPRARRRKTIHPEQLALLLKGQASEVYGYSFILTDIDDRAAVWVGHFHRHRVQIEERLKDAKLGQPLPSDGCPAPTKTPTAPGSTPACSR
ncbi:MAG: hypothetical protein LC790_21170 [Actinobacteria bacterium]|nr:hypothetical protein [Actinomycetota bacterium]